MDPVTVVIEQAKYWVFLAFLLGLGAFGLVGIGFVVIQLLKFRGREKPSLEYVVLQVAVPRDNETKIDAAEQMFASLFSIKGGGGWFGFLKPEEHLSFEIVAKKEDIRFYVAMPEKLRDLV